MKVMKPSLPKGTRDFSPPDMAKRNYIVSVIKGIFELYGYQRIETPAIENMSTLSGKYGEEGDKLLFKIVNSGDFLLKADNGSYEDKNSARFAKSIAEKGLHYDLTVPLARYVVMNRNDITFPFKRYQIQPVWRADKPQKGRYREFYQCDADVIGSDSLINEIELIQIFDAVFEKLKLDVSIQINNRKVLEGLAILYDVGGRFAELTVILDKMDKLGLEGIIKELKKNEFPTNMISTFFHDVKDDKLSGLESLDPIEEKFRYANIEIGLEGVEELRTVISKSKSKNIQVKLLLARGLDYYTGCIFEAVSNEMEFGTIGSGGRYDELTSFFGLENISGVGISFGLDRIFDVMTELNRFPENVIDIADILLIGFNEDCLYKALEYSEVFRDKGINTEVYPDIVKLKKSMKYADQRGFKRVGIIGEEELRKSTVSLKDMRSGEQKELSVEEMAEIVGRSQ